jgi:hypothetical protein
LTQPVQTNNAALQWVLDDEDRSTTAQLVFCHQFFQQTSTPIVQLPGNRVGCGAMDSGGAEIARRGKRIEETATGAVNVNKRKSGIRQRAACGKDSF